MTNRHVAKSLDTIANQLLPILWRLQWLSDRLPEGRSFEVVAAAEHALRTTLDSINQETSVLERYADAEEAEACARCGHPVEDHQASRPPDVCCGYKVDR